MARLFLILHILIVTIRYSQLQSIPRCAYSKLPCQYGSEILRAGKNEFSVHYTRLKNTENGSVECIIRSNRQMVQPLPLYKNNSNIKLISSPGFPTTLSYDSQILAEYRVSCAANQIMIYNITNLDIQPEDCNFNGLRLKVCSDYILVDRGVFGTTEICGNLTSNLPSTLSGIIRSNQLNVTFRSDEARGYPGFEMVVFCYQPDICDMKDCLYLSFESCVSLCNGLPTNTTTESGFLSNASSATVDISELTHSISTTTGSMTSTLHKEMMDLMTPSRSPLNESSTRYDILLSKQITIPPITVSMIRNSHKFLHTEEVDLTPSSSPQTGTTIRDKPPRTPVVAIVVSSLVATTILAVFIIGISLCVRRLRRKRREQIHTINTENNKGTTTTGSQYIIEQANVDGPIEEDLNNNKFTLCSPSQNTRESGLVYRGYYNSQPVAVKTTKALASAIDKSKLLREVSVMMSFKHPNVMSLIGMCFDDEMPLVIMPFMSDGSVLDYVRQNRKHLYFSDQHHGEEMFAARKKCLDMCHQIAKGMSYLAQQRFVHRDLAARNCMIDGLTEGVIKVADFGLTEDMYGTNYYRRSASESQERVPLRWMAPESIESNYYDEATDVWSFGVTCWEVLTCGGVPYAGMPAMTLLTELRSGHRIDRPSNTVCSDEIWDLINSCWASVPKERPTFEDLVLKLYELLDFGTSYLKLQ